MKKIYVLLFSFVFVSSFGMAKTAKSDTKHEENKETGTLKKSAKINSSKLVNHKIGSGDTLYSIARKYHTTVDRIELVNGLKKGDNLKIGRLLRIPQNTKSPEKKSSDISLASVIQKIEKEKKKVHPEKIRKTKTIASAKKISNKKTSIEKKESKKLSSKTLISHKIIKGDSLYSIARNNHTTVDALKKINSIKSEKNLKLGQMLTIPRASQKMEPSVRIVKTKVIEPKKIKTEKNSVTHIVKKGDSLYIIAKNNDTTVEVLKNLNKIKSEKNLKLGQVLKIPGSSHASKTEIKIAKLETKTNKKTKIVKAETKKKTKIVKSETKTKKRIASTQKLSHKKQVIDAGSSKKSILSRLSFGSKSSLKLASAKKQLGKRYVYGATGPRTFDCSGFTSYVCKKNGVCLPRTSINQSKVGKRVSRKNLKAGDLIFFDTSKRHRGYVNHVGIYLGNNKFIHASSAKRKVVITSLEKPFYKSRFKWGSRVKG